MPWNHAAGLFKKQNDEIIFIPPLKTAPIQPPKSKIGKTT